MAIWIGLAQHEKLPISELEFMIKIFKNTKKNYRNGRSEFLRRSTKFSLKFRLFGVIISCNLDKSIKIFKKKNKKQKYPFSDFRSTC